MTFEEMIRALEHAVVVPGIEPQTTFTRPPGGEGWLLRLGPTFDGRTREFRGIELEDAVDEALLDLLGLVRHADGSLKFLDNIIKKEPRC